MYQPKQAFNSVYHRAYLFCYFNCSSELNDLKISSFFWTWMNLRSDLPFTNLSGTGLNLSIVVVCYLNSFTLESSICQFPVCRLVVVTAIVYVKWRPVMSCPVIISSFCAESLPTADVEYVEIQPQKKRKVRKEKEDEVQYGEVMFTNNRSSAHPRPQMECIYSPVHRC